MRVLIKIVGVLFVLLLLVIMGFRAYYSNNHSKAQKKAEEVCQYFQQGKEFDYQPFQKMSKDLGGSSRCYEEGESGSCQDDSPNKNQNLTASASFAFFIRASVDCEVTVQNGSIIKTDVKDSVD